MVKILNQEYLLKYWSSVIQTWHKKCTSQKKQNEACGALAKATLLAPVSFCQKPKPHFQAFWVGQRILLGTDMVLILSKLCSSDFWEWMILGILVHNKKNINIFRTKEKIQKGKRHSPVFWKAFQITSNYFSFHRHFNDMVEHLGLFFSFVPNCREPGTG